ncbi:hypothetical protein H257_05549 [Aphanomyces astaci]|uniref:Uncharacterized protein n=1 Tax=Aphanomyces astaci TaxID=112090 RepID=W4GSN3_APHAT|nr:hypothetical protein H257_05549 [Aphanomyces astaci]ETV82024.1 hypothetical protein H257_05549 [Aphanomyces astaci]|eukprot:XP_009828761.1 hypothetical protein H257_05549 [Aphanomyces astaci]
MKNLTELEEWGQAHRCDTAEAFFTVAYAHELRVLTSVVLQHTIPRVLVSDQIATDTSPGLWAVCPISTEVLEKALTV